MVALGVMGDASELGIEASATVRRVGDKVTRFEAGDRVVVCGKGLFRTRAHFREHECTKIPPGLSLEDAAAVSAVYATAFYALITVGQIQPGQVRRDSVLSVKSIAVGQADISERLSSFTVPPGVWAWLPFTYARKSAQSYRSRLDFRHLWSLANIFDRSMPLQDCLKSVIICVPSIGSPQKTFSPLETIHFVKVS